MKKKLLLTCCLFVILSAAHSQGLSLPYVTGFDSPAEQAGWQQYRTGFLSTYAWGVGGGGFSGMGVSHDYNVGGNPNDTVVDWFISPPLNFTGQGQMSLKVNTSGFSTPFPDSFEILFGTNQQDPSNGNFTVIANLSYMQPQFQWLDTSITIPFVSDSAYIALKYKTIGAAWSTYKFDNISIQLAPVSVAEFDLRHFGLACFPNPMMSTTTIDIPEEIRNKTLEFLLRDVCGKEVFCKQQSGLAQMRFNREGIPSGLYFIEVVCDKTQIQTIKLLIGN